MIMRRRIPKDQKETDRINYQGCKPIQLNVYKTFLTALQLHRLESLARKLLQQ